MKTIEATIEGLSPLLMHAYPMAPVEALEKKTPEEQAELCAYRDERRELYLPGTSLQRALVSGATYSRGKGRGNLSRVVAACVLVTPERIPLGMRDYVVDTRPVVVPATKGRVLRHRPRIEKWRCSLEAEYDENLLTAQQLRRIFDDTGSRVGLLDFRPEKRGPFGRFSVVSWEAGT